MEGEQAQRIPIAIEMDLVPAWSNVVEKIAWAHGDNVSLSPSENGVVIEVDLLPSRRDAFEDELRIYWKRYRDWETGRR